MYIYVAYAAWLVRLQCLGRYSTLHCDYTVYTRRPAVKQHMNTLGLSQPIASQHWPMTYHLNCPPAPLKSSDMLALYK